MWFYQSLDHCLFNFTSQRLSVVFKQALIEQKRPLYLKWLLHKVPVIFNTDRSRAVVPLLHYCMVIAFH